MPIYKPSELRLFLSELNISPKKVLSQNFLIDGNIIRKIVETAKVTADDIVLEIGPGPGSLTEALLDKGASVIAVEKDRVLSKALERLKLPERKLEIFCEDIMEFPLEEKISQLLSNGKKAKVIANLPYHLTTPILVQLVQMNHLFSSFTVMVQEEVARRFTAKPGTSDYSSFTLFLNFYSNPHYGFGVSQHCFFPEPKVQSAMVILDLKEPPFVSDVEQFFILTRTAFTHRRKMMRGSLRELYQPQEIEKTLLSMGLNPLSRPGELNLEQFIHLFETLQKTKDLF
jgi:16S rRNA (adenine1518-N6/adenine1519-N6)-dimethyltransferase